MNKIRAALVLAAFLLLLPNLASAQCSSSTPLPINTVLGRLGVNPGPCQAISFPTLAANIGAVTATRNINTSAPLAGGGSLAGDRTLSINANGISNALIRQSGALSLIGNSTNATANVADISAVANSSCTFVESASTIICGQLATAGIANNAVDNTKFRQSGALSLIGRSANSTGNVADIAATPGSSCIFMESSSSLACGAIATASISANAVTFAKFQTIAALSMFGNCTNATANGAAVTGIANQVLRVNGAGTSCGFGAIDLSQAAAATGTLQTGSVPAFAGGDVTGAGGSLVLTIGSNAVTNAKAAQMAAATLKGNPTNAVANATDFTIQGLTARGAPDATNDKIPLYDNATGTIKYVTPAAIASTATAGVSSIAGNPGAFTLSNGIKNATNDIQADPVFHRSYLAGLTLSTAGSSATFGISAGVAVDSTNAGFMSLASAYTKTTSAWALGTAAGSLDTGAIANSTWYHVHLIKRTDTGVVDVLISLSATAPTMPTSYTLFRRIGSMKTNGSAQWTQFVQVGDEFLWSANIADANNSANSTTAVSVTLTVPTGLQVNALFHATILNGAATNAAIFSSLDETDVAPFSLGTGAANASLSGGASAFPSGDFNLRASTSAQIRARTSSATGTYNIYTRGWIDTRGRNF